MEVESTKYKAVDVMSEWHTDLKDVDRKRRTVCSQQCRKA
jgi:hypothetical protein